MDRLRLALRDWIIPFGLLLLCCGLFVASGRGAYKTMVYLGLLAPALAAIALSPRAALQALLAQPVRLLLAVFVFWAASSSSWAQTPTDADDLFKYALFILLFVLAVSRELGPTDTRLQLTLRLAAWLAGLGAGVSLGIHYLIDGHGWTVRFNGLPPLYNPLVSGYFAGFFIAVLMSDFVARRLARHELLLGLFAATALIAFVLLTQSRTPLLALLVAALLLAAVHRNLRGGLVALLAILAGVVLLLFADHLWERGLSWRPWIWGHVLERYLEKPWLGHGLGDELPIVLPGLGWEFWDTHNMHLTVLYFTGLPGAIAWLALLAVALHLAWQHRQRPEGLLALSLFGYGMVAACFDGGGLISRPRENWLILWLPLALIARLPQRPHQP